MEIAQNALKEGGCAFKMVFSWHETTLNKFIYAREHNHLPHALLLFGDDGIGKKILADSIAKSLLCLEPQNHLACNNCQACKTYESEANPDYLHITLLEGKQQISVDQIRELSSFLNYTNSFNAHKVILLNPVERMNLNAANSLLKSLEEPAEGTVILLLATHLNGILPTIKSRCQLLPIRKPSKTEALEWINENSPQTENPELALEIANGRPLHAINVDQDVIDKKEQLATDILDAINNKKPITQIAKTWEKYDLEVLLNWQALWLQAFIKNGSLSPSLLAIKNKIPQDQQWQLYQDTLDLKRLVHTSVNPLIFLENMIMLWTSQSLKGTSPN